MLGCARSRWLRICIGGNLASNHNRPHSLHMVMLQMFFTIIEMGYSPTSLKWINERRNHCGVLREWAPNRGGCSIGHIYSVGSIVLMSKWLNRWLSVGWLFICASFFSNWLAITVHTKLFDLLIWPRFIWMLLFWCARVCCMQFDCKIIYEFISNVSEGYYSNVWSEQYSTAHILIHRFYFLFCRHSICRRRRRRICIMIH